MRREFRCEEWLRRRCEQSERVVEQSLRCQDMSSERQSERMRRRRKGQIRDFVKSPGIGVREVKGVDYNQGVFEHTAVYVAVSTRSRRRTPHRNRPPV